MCATLGVCLKFLTLLVFEIFGTQKSGNWKNVKKNDGSGRFILLND